MMMSLRDEALRRLQERTPASLARKAKGAAILASEAVPTFSMVSPIYIDSADGVHMTDVDGNRYLDLVMGFGVSILGHSPAVVRDAMLEQLERGWHTVLPNIRQQELAAGLPPEQGGGGRILFTSAGPGCAYSRGACLLPVCSTY